MQMFGPNSGEQPDAYRARLSDSSHSSAIESSQDNSSSVRAATTTQYPSPSLSWQIMANDPDRSTSADDPAMTTRRRGEQRLRLQAVRPRPDPAEVRCGARAWTRGPRALRGVARTPPRSPRGSPGPVIVVLTLDEITSVGTTPQPHALVLNHQHVNATVYPWLCGHMVEPEQRLHQRGGVRLSGRGTEPQFNPVMKRGGHAHIIPMLGQAVAQTVPHAHAAIGKARSCR